MTYNNYKIIYECIDRKGVAFKSGVIIAKRKMSEFDALAGLENYLKKKYTAMVKMKCLGISVETMIGYIPAPNSREDIVQWLKNLANDGGTRVGK